MAALETPWTTSDDRHHHHTQHYQQHYSREAEAEAGPMSPTDPSSSNSNNTTTATTTSSSAEHSYHPPTVAAFSPSFAAPARRSTLQVHQKSPLLVATPPQVTRALSRAYPWIKTLDYTLGLVTWTTGDPWESFLLVAFFWGVALYGGWLLRWVGNVVTVGVIIVAMFARRYKKEETTTLDEILAALNSLNMRVDVFMAPCLALLDVLSTEKSATTVTTRPALTTLFIRILLLTPVWLFVSVYPLQILTPRRIVIFSGTLFLSWHSRPAKVSRTILWRSSTLRRLSEQITGLSLTPQPLLPPLPPRDGFTATADAAPTTADRPTPLNATTAAASPGVKFTFAIYENQRRWLGVGWTSTLFAYERAAWTDEHLQACPPPHEFALPATTRGSGVAWRWVSGEEWVVEGAAGEQGGRSRAKQEVKDRLGGAGEQGEGWWYYDNKWRDGRRGVDGWGKYTRRRKWTRRAELVEADLVEQVVGEVPAPAPPLVEEKREAVELEAPEANGNGSAKRTPPPLPPRPPPTARDAEVQDEDPYDSAASDYGDDDDAAHRRQVRLVDPDGGVLAEGR
ncbi:integral peroxisomal membrane peroxin-domain-containing protein [Tricharina praecox]|uniref:integral peroxisomal membrane peroxin-domain-containing protein n=1 Tax=Tricharina praecox TaxID=43433 RepID=UPI00222091B2|nr:integral peroxisomal membrane peroxin-domain-containing protein [Tricharina praecox]KAI5848011.1 integral peroxisomal membrane peroxin-domain-containing protein [Tricharina praecox]